MNALADAPAPYAHVPGPRAVVACDRLADGALRIVGYDFGARRAYRAVLRRLPDGSWFLDGKARVLGEGGPYDRQRLDAESEDFLRGWAASLGGRLGAAEGTRSPRAAEAAIQRGLFHRRQALRLERAAVGLAAQLRERGTRARDGFPLSFEMQHRGGRYTVRIEAGEPLLAIRGEGVDMALRWDGSPAGSPGGLPAKAEQSLALQAARRRPDALGCLGRMLKARWEAAGHVAEAIRQESLAVAPEPTGRGGAVPVAAHPDRLPWHDVEAVTHRLVRVRLHDLHAAAQIVALVGFDGDRWIPEGPMAAIPYRSGKREPWGDAGLADVLSGYAAAFAERRPDRLRALGPVPRDPGEGDGAAAWDSFPALVPVQAPRGTEPDRASVDAQDPEPPPPSPGAAEPVAQPVAESVAEPVAEPVVDAAAAAQSSDHGSGQAPLPAGGAPERGGRDAFDGPDEPDDAGVLAPPGRLEPDPMPSAAETGAAPEPPAPADATPWDAPEPPPADTTVQELSVQELSVQEVSSQGVSVQEPPAFRGPSRAEPEGSVPVATAGAADGGSSPDRPEDTTGIDARDDARYDPGPFDAGDAEALGALAPAETDPGPSAARPEPPAPAGAMPAGAPIPAPSRRPPVPDENGLSAAGLPQIVENEGGPDIPQPRRVGGPKPRIPVAARPSPAVLAEAERVRARLRADVAKAEAMARSGRSYEFPYRSLHAEVTPSVVLWIDPAQGKVVTAPGKDMEVEGRKVFPGSVYDLSGNLIHLTKDTLEMRKKGGGWGTWLQQQERSFDAIVQDLIVDGPLGIAARGEAARRKLVAESPQDPFMEDDA